MCVWGGGGEFVYTHRTATTAAELSRGGGGEGVVRGGGGGQGVPSTSSQ